MYFLKQTPQQKEGLLDKSMVFVEEDSFTSSDSESIEEDSFTSSDEESYKKFGLCSATEDSSAQHQEGMRIKKLVKTSSITQENKQNKQLETNNKDTNFLYGCLFSTSIILAIAAIIFTNSFIFVW